MTVTDGYYTAQEIAQDIWQIGEPGGVYSYLIEGKSRAALIDAGYGFADIRRICGFITDKPTDVLLTHGHTDHYGGAFYFPYVYMNTADFPVYRAYEDVQKQLIVSKFRRDRAQAGLPDVWPADFDERKYMAMHIGEFRLLQDKQIMDLGGRELEMIALPGHTRGSMVILDRKSGLAFSGDSVSCSYWGFFSFSRPLHEYAENLERAAQIPVKGYYAAHYQVMFPPQITEDILKAIGQADPERDGHFRHPRTGQPARRHIGPCTCMDTVSRIYIVYDDAKM